MATPTTTPPPVADRAAPPIPAGRRLRVPQLTVGILLTGLMALAFLLWNATTVQRVPVVALAEAVVRGQILTVEDLQVVHVGTDDQLAVTPAEDATTLVGRAAVTDLPAGTLVVAEQLAAGATLVEGAGVVGLALSPGQYPTPRLRIGDLVNVLAVADHDGGRLLVEAAEVVGVDPVGTQGQVFVSLQAGEEQAGEVATTAATGEVRLVLVARDVTDVGGGR